MSQQHATVPPTMVRDQLVKAQREDFGADALATISNEDNVDVIQKVLKDTDADLTITGAEYQCTTQTSMLVPSSKGILELEVGLGGQVPRWKKGSVVNWAAYSGGYPSPNHATFAAHRLNEAAQIWNRILGGRVTFKWVSKVDDAAFVLGYGGNNGTVLARAYFPNSAALNGLIVYQRAFGPGNINFLTNIFLHELGHILGFRHEFAAQEGQNVRFGPANPFSVMSYKFPPKIQPSDEDTARKFYDFTGPKIGPYPIVDYVPDN